jgi:hypothetical protein
MTRSSFCCRKTRPTRARPSRPRSRASMVRCCAPS